MRKFYKISREDIEEVSPDEWDLAMLNEIKNTPEEQQSYITQEQLLAELGLQDYDLWSFRF